MYLNPNKVAYFLFHDIPIGIASALFSDNKSDFEFVSEYMKYCWIYDNT